MSGELPIGYAWIGLLIMFIGANIMQHGWCLGKGEQESGYFC